MYSTYMPIYIIYYIYIRHGSSRNILGCRGLLRQIWRVQLDGAYALSCCTDLVLGDGVYAPLGGSMLDIICIVAPTQVDGGAA